MHTQISTSGSYNCVVSENCQLQVKGGGETRVNGHCRIVKIVDTSFSKIETIAQRGKKVICEIAAYHIIKAHYKHRCVFVYLSIMIWYFWMIIVIF